MDLKAKLPNVTFDERVVGATDSLTRPLTQTVIEVLALLTGDASPFHMESDGKKT